MTGKSRQLPGRSRFRSESSPSSPDQRNLMRTKRVLSSAATFAALSLLLAVPAAPASAAPAAAPVVAAAVAAAVQPAAQAAAATYTAGSQLAGYPVSNVGDGDQNTYWESANNQFPQWVQ